MWNCIRLHTPLLSADSVHLRQCAEDGCCSWSRSGVHGPAQSVSWLRSGSFSASLLQEFIPNLWLSRPVQVSTSQWFQSSKWLPFAVFSASHASSLWWSRRIQLKTSPLADRAQALLFRHLGSRAVCRSLTRPPTPLSAVLCRLPL